MVKGLGIDIVETGRIRQVIERHGETFLNRVFTSAERELGRRKGDTPHFYAGRWASKEAVSKALGCGIGSECAFTEIEVLETPIGVPLVHLHGGAAIVARQLGGTICRVSISHEKEYAVATAIIE